MSKEIQVAIDSILSDKAIVFNAQYVGEKQNAFGDNDKSVMDQWIISLSGNGKLETFDFFTGLGHRKWDKPYSGKKVLPHGFKSHNYTQSELGNPRSIHYEQMAKANLKPMAPCAADVLYSLVMDSYAMECSFSDWCSEFGYDEDSRKALETYLLCQKLGEQLQKIFDHATLEQVKTLLQDY